MKTAFAALAALTLLGARPAAAPAKLELKVITASPEGFLVNATLITGARDAVLIDAAFTRADARRIVEAVRASGKNRSRSDQAGLPERPLRRPIGRRR